MSENQDVYTANVDAGLQMYIVPVTVENAEHLSVMLELMSYEGYKTVIPAFYEVALQGKYTRDDDSAKMLDIIKESRIFDFGYYTNYSHQIGCAGYYLAQSNSRELSSY